jgi:methyl-accepting chemotaxis protein
MTNSKDLSMPDNAEGVLQPQRAAADRIMLSMMVFLLLVCLGLGWQTDTTALAVWVGLAALLVPWMLYRAAPGALVCRLAIACALIR